MFGPSLFEGEFETVVAGSYRRQIRDCYYPESTCTYKYITPISLGQLGGEKDGRTIIYYKFRSRVRYN